MKNLLFLLAFIALAGCTPYQSAMVTGDFDYMFQAMEGTGSVSRAPDGTDTFNWVVAANAYDGITPEQDQKAQREAMMAKWVGGQDICQKGYKITSVSENSGYYVYEGRCN